MEAMFNRCHKLKQIKGIEKLQNVKIFNKRKMFDECAKLVNNGHSYPNTNHVLTYQSNVINHNNFNPNPVINTNNRINEQPQGYTAEIIAVDFFYQGTTYPVACMSSDILSKVENNLYLRYPELKNNNNYFISKGKVMNSEMTLEQNGIKNGDKILMFLHQN